MATIKIEIPIEYFEKYSELIIKPSPLFGVSTTNDGGGYVAVSEYKPSTKE